MCHSAIRFNHQLNIQTLYSIVIPSLSSTFSPFELRKVTIFFICNRIFHSNAYGYIFYIKIISKLKVVTFSKKIVGCFFAYMVHINFLVILLSYVARILVSIFVFAKPRHIKGIKYIDTLNKKLNSIVTIFLL